MSEEKYGEVNPQYIIVTDGIEMGTGSSSSTGWYNLTTTDVTAYTISEGTTAEFTWQHWNTNSVTTPAERRDVVYNRLIQRVTETEEQKAARLAHEEEQRRIAWTREQEVREKKRKADERAKVLLYSLLSPQQIKMLELESHFFEQGEQHLYRINVGTSGNIAMMDDKDPRKIAGHLCIHPLGLLPTYDVMASQVMMIRSREDAFLRVANHS